MTEATQAAHDMINENDLDILEITGSGTDGKVIVPDVEKYMAENEDEADGESDDGESESSDETDAPDSEEDGSETDAETDDPEGGESPESESEASEESEEDESDDNEPEPAPESRESHPKGALICVFHVKEDGIRYKPGDKYKGKKGKYLLSRGAIRKVK